MIRRLINLDRTLESARAWATWATCLPLVLVLSGCVAAVATGVGAGALMVTDRRAAETYVTDEGIELRAADRIKDNFGRKVRVSVVSYNRNVLLVGQVPDEATKVEAEKLVGGVPNVKAISNELQIGSAQSLTGESSDAYITTKVKARFVDANKFATNHVKVVTEAGVVYLLGIVTQREADAAVEIARTTAGVQKVVRVFEIISDQDARQIDNRSPPDTGKKS